MHHELGRGAYFWNFTIVKLRPDRDKENQRPKVVLVSLEIDRI